jgi:hypothetical protein
MIVSEPSGSGVELEDNCHQEHPLEDAQTLLLYPRKLLDQAKGWLIRR